MLAQIYDIFDVNGTLNSLIDDISGDELYKLNIISKITQLVGHFDNFKNDRHISIFLKFFHFPRNTFPGPVVIGLWGVKILIICPLPLDCFLYFISDTELFTIRRQ